MNSTVQQTSTFGKSKSRPYNAHTNVNEMTAMSAAAQGQDKSAILLGGVGQREASPFEDSQDGSSM